jgi:hypothetical protein
MVVVVAVHGGVAAVEAAHAGEQLVVGGLAQGLRVQRHLLLASHCRVIVLKVLLCEQRTEDSSWLFAACNRITLDPISVSPQISPNPNP